MGTGEAMESKMGRGEQ
jgi:hypothetical protein